MTIEKRKIFEMNHLFVPCLVNNNHWTCVVVRFRTKIIDYYDSLSNETNTSVTNIIKKFLNDLMAELCLTDGHIHHKVQQKWKLRNNFCERGTIPLQHNNIDCGVYMCVYVYCFARNIPFNFDYRDINVLRERIAYSIVKCSLLKPFWKSIA